MEILEITLENPISHTEINRLKADIEAEEICDYLMIDSGNHDFISLSVIKYFKQQMLALETPLSRFKKIALIHPPEYTNESSNPEKYNYFTSGIKAKAWFLL